ncbi:MAG: hypothetical protein AAGN82_23635 [Myxococcota bacterium]
MKAAVDGRRAVVASGLAVVILTAFGCALESFDRGPAPAPPPPPPPVPQVCSAAVPPARPDEELPEGDTSFVVAVRSVTWPPLPAAGDDEDGDARRPNPERVGFDLDGRCSCTDDVGLACVSAPTAFLQRQCDDARGRDNNLGAALAPLNAVAPRPLSELLSGAAEGGVWSLLIEVAGYNDRRDDQRVTVTTHSAAGFEGGLGAPTWDGEDAWTIRADGFAADEASEESTPISVDPEAYVRDGMLVAHLPRVDLDVVFATASGRLRVTDVRLVATIEEAPSGLALVDGTLGGWLSEENALRMLASYQYQPPGPNTPLVRLCNPRPEYTIFRAAVCRAADGRVDEGSPDRTCNAVSVGVGFSASAARLGSVLDVPFPSPECAPGDDPREDACPPP